MVIVYETLNGSSTASPWDDVVTVTPVAGHSRCVAVADGKGGVGKTSLTANLGGLVAESGYRVLLVSADPQDNLGEDLGYGNAGMGDEGANLVAAIRGQAKLEPMRDIRPRLDVACGGARIEDDLLAYLYLTRAEGGQYATALGAALSGVAEEYDLILIDCPPGYHLLQQLALVAARWIVIPAQADASSRKGMSFLAERVAEASADNPDLGLLGVVLFDVPANGTRIRARAAEAIAADLGGAELLFDTAIRTAKGAASDCRERGQLMHEMVQALNEGPRWWERRKTKLPKAEISESARTVAGDYQALAQEVLARLVEQEQA